VLLADLNNVAGAAVLAREWAQKFEYPEYIDLGDFVNELALQLPQNVAVKSASENILKALGLTTEHGFVIQNARCGPKEKRASGLSIYFPTSGNYSPDYSDLTFCKEGNWRKFLEALLVQKSQVVQVSREEKQRPNGDSASVEPIQTVVPQGGTPPQDGVPLKLAQREAEGWMQPLKEGVAAILALGVVGFTLSIALYAIMHVAQDKFSSAKDIIMLLLGPFGTVLGYYFGRLPADARAAQAQQQTAQAQQQAAEADSKTAQLTNQTLNVVQKADELATKASGTIAAAQTRGLRGEQIAPVDEEVRRLRSETKKLLDIAVRR